MSYISSGLRCLLLCLLWLEPVSILASASQTQSVGLAQVRLGPERILEANSERSMAFKVRTWHEGHARALRAHMAAGRLSHVKFSALGSFPTRGRSLSSTLPACESSNLPPITNFTSFSFPIPNLSPPWSRPGSVVYKSVPLDQTFAQLRSELVPDLSTTRLITFGEVFDIFASAGCIVYLKGGLVRDSLLSQRFKDIDSTVSCTTISITSILNNQSWAFTQDPLLPVFTLGNARDSAVLNGLASTLDTITWGTLAGPFADAIEFDYTANSLFYDITNQVILDVLGVGTHDTCLRLIRIPTPEPMWPTWFTVRKLLRYWRINSAPLLFTPVDSDVTKFIVTAFNNTFATNPNTTIIADTTRFFCSRLNQGVWNENDFGCQQCSALTLSGKASRDAYTSAMNATVGEIAQNVLTIYASTRCSGSTAMVSGVNYVGAVIAMIASWMMASRFIY